MFKNENGENVGFATELFNEIDALYPIYIGTSSNNKGEKKLIYSSELYSTELTEKCEYSVKAYAVYSTRKGANDRYGFKDFIFEVSDEDGNVIFESCSSTELHAYVGELLNDIEEKADEDRMFDESNKMYEYASEAHKKIEDSVKDIMQYGGYLHGDDLDGAVEDIMTIRGLFRDIEDALADCLDKCSDLTGCKIGWDDFCGAEYFDDISNYITISNIADSLDSFDEFEYLIKTLLKDRFEDEISYITEKYFQMTNVWLDVA